MVRRVSTTSILIMIKDIEDIGDYFEVKPKGIGKKIILVEKEKANNKF